MLSTQSAIELRVQTRAMFRVVIGVKNRVYLECDVVHTERHLRLQKLALGLVDILKTKPGHIQLVCISLHLPNRAKQLICTTSEKT